MKHQLIIQVWLTLICLVLVPLECSVNAEEKEDSTEVFDIDDFPVEQLRFNFLQAKPGAEKGKAAHFLFRDRTPADVNYLCYDKDDSIAFCGAWKRLKMQMDARMVGIDSGLIRTSIPQRLSREFIGFVEGRLKVPVPDAWAKNLISARYDSQELFMFEMKPLPFVQYQNENHFTLPYITFFNSEKREETEITFVAGNATNLEDFGGVEVSATLPPMLKQAFTEKLKKPEQIYATGIATQGRGVIVLKDDGPIHPKLMCIATNDSKEQPQLFWEIPLDSYWLPSFSGSSWFTEFRVRNDLLYLFHCNNYSIGIECISFKDGSRIFSFNSLWPK